MKYTVITKEDIKENNLFKKLDSFLHKYLKNADTYIFDIHNTIEYGENNMDTAILNFINNYHDKMNIILLSYDGNDARIISNNDKLDNYSDVFKQTPKIFIKKRKKHYIIGTIASLLIEKFGSCKSISFFDDNYLNIIDAKKLRNIPVLNIIHYTAHSTRKSDESVDDITDLLPN